MAGEDREDSCGCCLNLLVVSIESLLCAGFFVFAGCAEVGTTRRGSLFRSCPPSACGLLLLDLTKQTPPPRRAAHGWPADNIRGEKVRRLLRGVMASTGHRGRVDARGPHAHLPAGLTRTSGRSAGAPSRDRRARRFASRGWSGAAANAMWWRADVFCAARSAALVSHEKERLRAGPSFASGPVPCPRAGRGHRRGLDGPPMPKPIQKMSEHSPRECCQLASHAWHGEAGESVL